MSVGAGVSFVSPGRHGPVVWDDSVGGSYIPEVYRCSFIGRVI
jgi:hypothetical protein